MYLAWVEAAFGPFWAFQKGWLSWFSGVSGIYAYAAYLLMDYTYNYYITTFF